MSNLQSGKKWNLTFIKQKIWVFQYSYKKKICFTQHTLQMKRIGNIYTMAVHHKAINNFHKN